ncbi:MOFRL family protein, partial [Thiocapsa sp.]|uniref:MOFRL family protein n=1 Tax=Thiocapsa sp. TaxID=2024551 RepID=UPI0025D99D58
RMNQWLLGSGLPIDAVNRVRKSVSRIKGGGLLSALGERPSRALAISDVPGNEPGVIGSGLLVAEVGLVEGVAGLDLPKWLSDCVERGLAERGALPMLGPQIELVATLETAKSAAADAGRRAGLAVRIDTQPVEGDAALVGRHLARALLDGPPGLSITGGETTLCLPDAPGRGGRNQHLALAAAIELAGHADAVLLSAGTDGTDGPTDDAGALVDGATLERIRDAGLDADRGLRRADSGTLLEASGDLIRTGPTGTNVMDLILGWRG